MMMLMMTARLRHDNDENKDNIHGRRMTVVLTLIMTAMKRGKLLRLYSRQR